MDAQTDLLRGSSIEGSRSRRIRLFVLVSLIHDKCDYVASWTWTTRVGSSSAKEKEVWRRRYGGYVFKQANDRLYPERDHAKSDLLSTPVTRPVRLDLAFEDSTLVGLR